MTVSPERVDRPRRVYLDHAATSWPKLPAAVEAAFRFVQECGATTGRGSYRSAQTAQTWLSDARLALAKLVHAPNSACVAFCTSGTHALNAALCGWLQPGDHVLTTAIEHNSLLRPLSSIALRSAQVTPSSSAVESTLRERMLNFSIAPCDERGFVSPESIANLIQPNTRLIAVGHASNVTGTVQPLAEIAEIARRQEAKFLVDASQTLGYLPLDVQAMGIDLLAAAGHKGLRALPGTGVLVVAPDMQSRLQPVLTGGTGTASELIDAIAPWPLSVEVGNLNLPGIVSLAIAARQADTSQSWRPLLEQLQAGLREMSGVRMFGSGSAASIPVASLTVDGWDNHDLANVLDANFGIETRAGLHCAAKIHDCIGSTATGGTLRISLGHDSTGEDVESVLTALREIIG